MRRREFIAGLEVAAAWPIVTRAQQDGRVRRIGVLSSLAEDDPNVPARLAAFEQGLQELTWTVGRNIQIDYRFGAADPNLLRKYEQLSIPAIPISRSRRSRSPIPIDPDQYGAVC
jgi:putative ABC transport system substrate-binding protein